MNNNLPGIKKEGIFIKIRKFFRDLLGIGKIEEKAIEEIKSEEIDKEDFLERLKVESKQEILVLQLKLKENEITISDLTDKELDEMIELYKKQVEEKKKKLINYRKKLVSY